MLAVLLSPFLYPVAAAASSAQMAGVVNLLLGSPAPGARRTGNRAAAAAVVGLSRKEKVKKKKTKRNETQLQWLYLLAIGLFVQHRRCHLCR